MKPSGLALRLAVTFAAVALAVVAGVFLWRTYMLEPWTRDGRIRAEVVRVASDVSGQIVALGVRDNQFVRAGQSLFTIDQARFRLAVQQAQATLDARRANLRSRQAQAQRRAALSALAVSQEEKETFQSQALQAQAAVAGAESALATAQLNLQRTDVRAPVNGYVTNLTLRAGNYAAAGQAVLSIVDSDSFWIAGYFEETKLPRIRENAMVRAYLLGARDPIEGHVVSIARGIADENGAANGEGLATTNPNFTWVRLAQRIPVRIKLDKVPPGTLIVAGQTCTVEVGEAPPGAPAISEAVTPPPADDDVPQPP